MERTESCWLWRGYQCRTTQYGSYGREKAHRASWILTYGEIPTGLHVLHRCDNPRCVRPDHLFLGTHQDNMTDKVAKGRSRDGEHSHHAKLTADAVRAIRRKRQLGWRLTDLAVAYGISISHTCGLCTGHFWRRA